MRRSPPSAAAHLGYEPALLAELSPAHRTQLDALSIGWGLSCLWLAAPAAILVWQIEHSAVLATCIALAAMVLAANLLRLLVAGGGVPVDRPWPASYRPGRSAGVLLGALALVLAQPAQLALDAPRADAKVRAHRAALLAAHREALATLGSVATESGASDTFQRQLEDCEFVALRLGAMWEQPRRASVFTSLFALLVLIPFLLSRSLWLSAVSAYERARHQRVRARARADTHRADASVETALAQFSGDDKAPRPRHDPAEERA